MDTQAAQLGRIEPCEPNVPSRPNDLGSLQALLEVQVDRARDIAMRAEGIGEQIFGPRPASLADGLKQAETNINPLAGVVSQLANVLTRIEVAQSRL